MKQIDNRQKIITKSRVGRAGKHDPHVIHDKCGHEHHEHDHEKDETQKTTPLKPITHQKIGRNEPCPCGSGKKYKKCCLDKDESNG